MSSQLLIALLFLAAAHGRAYAAEPGSLECLAAYELSIPLRNEHKLSVARAQLLLCAAAKCPRDVRAECTKRAEDIDAQMPTISFDVRDREGRELAAVSVSMDGVTLVEKLGGAALTIDPGPHEFVFQIEGAPPVSTRLEIRDGDKDRHEKVIFASLPLQAPPEPEPEPEPDTILQLPPAALLKPPAPPAPPEPDHTRRIAGIIVTSVGAAALGVALYEQVSARNHYADSQQAAKSQDLSVRATKHGLYEQAQQAQTTAIVLAVIGAAALLPGVYLLMSGDTAAEARDARAQALTPWADPRGGGLTYTRDF